jgi:CelD/BcsL family acetyltransferase involved in cellulose biosynthesis
MGNATLRSSERPSEDSGAGARRTHPRQLQSDGDAESSSEPRALPWMAASPISPAACEPVQSTSGAGVDIRIYTDLGAFEAPGNSFEAHGAHAVFQWFYWLAAWQRDVGAQRGTVPAIVVGREGDGQVLFVLPLAIETGGAIRRLTWLGSTACDYNAPLLSPQFFSRMSAQRFARAWNDVIRIIRADPHWGFDLIDLQKMPGMVGAQRNPFLDLPALTYPSGAWCDDEELHDCLAAVTAKGWLLAAMTAAYRRTKQVIEQSPTLQRASRKAKALIGWLSER